MRVLVIGYPLPDAAIDNYSALNAPSYADYDALVVDPASITRDVREVIEEGAEYSAHDSRPVRNAPSTASTVASMRPGASSNLAVRSSCLPAPTPSRVASPASKAATATTGCPRRAV
jgi:hypothetical protein